ncbi:hypothetical protein PR048_011091 [Dryococelus australis]|uniref:PiggyBac transposable element-derived protein domain-containing protein n=1 Tax=Dryococelus australis TaxID=614101 RepID=A0ABQ9HKK9_9NEOP|nr:hypothetical protein PR048_011091 [Dryococelus australis]
MYDFVSYTGKGMTTNLTNEQKTFGIGGQVIILLCKSLPQEKNRLKGCPLEEEKILQNSGRGSYDFRMDRNSGIIIVRWVDNKVVRLENSFYGIQPVYTVKHWNSSEKRKTDMPCPNIVTQYNKHMGGFDLAVMLIELYQVPLKSKTRDRKTWLKKFRVDIANGLMAVNKRKAGRPSLGLQKAVPVQDVSYDSIDHMPEYGPKG